MEGRGVQDEYYNVVGRQVAGWTEGRILRHKVAVPPHQLLVP